MKDRWHYEGLGQVQYGNLESYRLACEWLDRPGWLVEDWGCGCAYARKFFKQARYVGIDGSQNEYADLCRIDLRDRVSVVNGILLRHVLDHNEDWRKILKNAIQSCSHRLSLVFFIPMGERTSVIGRTDDPKYPGVPDIQFCRQDIVAEISPMFYKSIVAGDDTLFLCEKNGIAESCCGTKVVQ